MVTNSKQPALRFYAVTGLASRTRVGRVWHVVDRRVQGKSQLLFVPNRKRAWPIWVEQLNTHDATPVRLRTGKVALLFSPLISQKDLKILLKVPSTLSHQFSATAGFRLGGRKLIGRFALSTIGSVFLLLGAIPLAMAGPSQVELEPTNSPQIASNVLCERQPVVGETISKSISRGKVVSLNQRKYKILQMNDLGGLHRIRVIRLCDKEGFDLQAWAYKTNLTISKIN